MVGARTELLTTDLSSTTPTLAVFASSRVMDVGSDFMVHNPSTMAQSHHLPSSVGHDGRGMLPHPIDTGDNASSKMRRKSIKGMATNSIKRSASTPNVSSLAASQETAMSLAEKRRNKLGYHRTSVACVHCRRRKIRCLLAIDDPQKRCSNCIRLKKECNFYPVDQQPPTERRRTGSKVEGMSAGTSTSSSSSPNMPTPHDQGDHFNQYQQIPLSSHAFPTPMMPMASSAMSPPGSAAPINPRYDSAEHQHNAGWDPRFFDGHQLPAANSVPEDQSNAYWKVPEPPMTPAFSPYSSGPPSSVFNNSNGSFSSFGAHPSRTDSGWQPIRSMSYSQLDEQAQHRPDGYPNAPYHPDMRRSTVDMLPPTLRTSTVSSTASMTESPAHATPATSQPMMQFGGPQGWGGIASQSPKTVDFGGHWYPEPSQLGKVQEEDSAHYSDHPPPPMYASAGHH